MNHLEKSCESVDASVFNGDALFDDGQRAMLKDYLARWNRAVSQHEGRAVVELLAAERDGGLIVSGTRRSHVHEEL